MSLGEYVRELMGGRATIVQSQDEGRGLDLRERPPVRDHVEQGRRAERRPGRPGEQDDADGVVDLDDVEEEPPSRRCRRRSRSSARATWDWSGSPGNDHRLTVEELEELHPGLVASVAAHPGVGLLLVRSKEFGAVVFGPKGTRFLDEDRVEGEDPTTLFGPHTIMSLKREDAMTHAPDLLLLSQYDPELGEVAAFEELIGSHGGLGGPQTEPFILHPVEWDARRGGAARRPGHLPQHPALARVDRHHARPPAGTGRRPPTARRDPRRSGACQSGG